jgi:pentatricopeptide repeat protein
MAGINACVVTRYDDWVADIANWAFGILHADKVATVETYESMISLCSKYNDVTRAEQLREQFVQQGYTFTSHFLSCYINLVAKHGDDSHMEKCGEMYNILLVK